jgi:hypothetical protein
MSLIKPAKLLPIRFTLSSILGPDVNGRQYRYNASLSLINPQIHSDSTEGNFYNLTDLNVGDYVSTNGSGKILKIVSIGAQAAEQATIIVEDELRTNQQQDPSGNAQGYIPSSEGIVFEVKEGRPILFPYSQYSESVIGFIKSTATEIISKFAYLRQDKLLSIEQAGSSALGLAVGDIVTYDDTTNAWKLMTATDVACGIVVETANPIPDAFRINPAGDVIDIELPDDASGNVYYYWDANNPGKLTQTTPTGGATRALPMFLKLDSKRAIHFDGANVNDQTSQFVTLGSEQTITATKTFEADQTFNQDITVVGNANINTDLTVQGSAQIDTNLTVTGDFTVNGTTTTVNTANTVITDQLIELNHGYTGPPMSADSGIVINRGPEDNVFFGWDETSNEFTVGTGTFDGSSTGTLFSFDANVRFGGIKSGSITSNTLTDNRILISGVNGLVEDDVNLSWDGSSLNVSGTGAVFTTGKVSVGNENSANVDHTMYVLYGTTSDAIQTQLELSGGLDVIIMDTNTTMQFEATIVGRNSLGSKHCSYIISGVIDKTGNVANLVNTVTETIVAESEETWVAEATASAGGLRISVTGEAATDIRWVSFIKTTSISF